MNDKVVKVIVGKDYAAKVTAGTHTIFVDEPKQAGGQDMGPDPYDYILSALGACTAITVRMYADRKQWKLESVEVLLSGGRNHPEDCVHCESPGFKMDAIKKQLILIGDLSAEQKERLKIISTKCPVQKTLEAGIHIETV